MHTTPPSVLNERTRTAIQNACRVKWPESLDQGATLAVSVACVTGKTRGIHSLKNIRLAYSHGHCCLLLLRDIARALDVPITQLMDA